MNADLNIIFNLFKVKYAKMDELLMRHCEGINPSSKINLYINLEPIIRKLASSNVDEYLKVRNDDKVNEMISNIINLAAHYRMFFTKNKLYSKIYFYIGYPFNVTYLNQEFIPDYRKDYKHRYTKDERFVVLGNIMDKVLTFTKIILEYVEGVYLITSNNLESAVVPKVIMEENKDTNINILLTNDRYEYQYVNKDCYILRAKQNDSYMVSKSNVISILKQEEKLSTELEVGSNFLTFMLSLLGDKSRNISKLKGIGLAGLLKILDKAINDELIGKDVSNINILERIVKPDYVPLLRTNFLCSDIDSQFMRLNLRNIHEITNQLTDKFDNVSLKKLNDDYFRFYPIQLIELTEANKLIKVKKTKDIFL